MSLYPAMCRICLAVDVRLLPIAGSLQSVFEKLTDTALHTADGRPVTACYICHAQLLKSHKLMLTSARAETVLSDVFFQYNEISLNNLSIYDHDVYGLSGSLTISKSHSDSIPSSEELKKDTDSACYNDCIETEEYAEIDVCEQASDCTEYVKDDNIPTGGVLVKQEIEIQEDFPEPYRVTVTGVKVETVSSDDGDKCDSVPADEAIWEDWNIFDEHSYVLLKEKKIKSLVQKRGRKKKNLTSLNGDVDGVKIPKSRRPRNPRECYKCEVCRRDFNYKYLFVNHLRTHTGVKPYKCCICDLAFPSQTGLKLHLCAHDGEKHDNDVSQQTIEKQYECHVCNHVFFKSSNLVNHLRMHKGEKLFHCDVCKREFTERSTLVRHMRIHTNEKPFQCDVCQKRFGRRNNLKRHYMMHTGEKPYKCNFCPKNFREVNSLQFHLRTHTGEKPHECAICGSRFSRSHHLKFHLKIHIGDKSVL